MDVCLILRVLCNLSASMLEMTLNRCRPTHLAQTQDLAHSLKRKAADQQRPSSKVSKQQRIEEAAQALAEKPSKKKRKGEKGGS